MDRTKVHRVSLSHMPAQSKIDVRKLLWSKYYFEQRLVYAILQDQTTQMLACPEELGFNHLASIKVEGMERHSLELHKSCELVAKYFRHRGPMTCHMFVAQQGAASFPLHTDPDDIYLHVLSGQKDLIVEGEEYTLFAGEGLYIPRGKQHLALNLHASVMLSYGLEGYAIHKY